MTARGVAVLELVEQSRDEMVAELASLREQLRKAMLQRDAAMVLATGDATEALHLLSDADLARETARRCQAYAEMVASAVDVGLATTSTLAIIPAVEMANTALDRANAMAQATGSLAGVESEAARDAFATARAAVVTAQRLGDHALRLMAANREVARG